jgi:pyridoxine 5-phosphate synthase
MATLGVNIDHIATLRQARYKTPHWCEEPHPVSLALLCIQAGAHNITAHLREDRRHMQDRDLVELKKTISSPLNFEMAVTSPMIDFAIKLKPSEVCLVPEKRQEVTTEGGLDVLAQFRKITQATRRIQSQSIEVSLFIDPIEDQVKAAAGTGAHLIELHTGGFANARTKTEQKKELSRLSKAHDLGKSLGLTVNAGHGLNYRNLPPFLKALPEVNTLNIGHTIVSRSIEVGIFRAVEEMVHLIKSSA